MSNAYRTVIKYSTQTEEYTPVEYNRASYSKLVNSMLYINDKMKLPGDYGLDERVLVATKARRFFIDKGYYCAAQEGTSDWLDYWRLEDQIVNGGLLIDDEYLITRDFYFYVNYMAIFDKITDTVTLPRFLDGDMWYFLLIEKCFVDRFHLMGVKGRQKGITLKNMAVQTRSLWFDYGFKNKILSFNPGYVDSAWEELDRYRDHINTHTAWYRDFSPDKTGYWKQQIESREYSGNGYKKVFNGRKSILTGASFTTSPSKTVSGKQNIVVIEEPGVAPNLLKVWGYLEPALKSASLVTGTAIVLGSVGELKEAAGLKSMCYNPAKYNAIEFDNVWDEDGYGQKCAMFFSPLYNRMGPEGSDLDCVDIYGNSLVDKAKRLYEEEKEYRKQSNDPSEYKFWLSQNPTTLKECFDDREQNIYPLELVSNRQHELDMISDRGIEVELHLGKDQRVTHSLVPYMNKKQVMDFPIKRGSDNPGSVVIYEFPRDNAPKGLYYAGVDPVSQKNSKLTDSLQCCYIVKANHSINGEYSHDMIVAQYIGKHDDSEETYRTTMNLIMFYNALAAVENNSEYFIQWVQKKGYQEYLLTKNFFTNLTELMPNQSSRAVYGYFKDGAGKIWDYITGLQIQYLEGVIEQNEHGVIRGIGLVRDRMLLEEMRQYSSKHGNYDRLNAWGAALWASELGSNIYKIRIRSEEEEEEPIINVSMTSLNKYLKPSAINKYSNMNRYRIKR